MFDTIVVFESFPEDESIGQQQGVRINPLSLREKGAYTLTAGRNNYPLSLMVEPGAELRLILCYARQLLQPWRYLPHVPPLCHAAGPHRVG